MKVTDKKNQELACKGEKIMSLASMALVLKN